MARRGGAGSSLSDQDTIDRELRERYERLAKDASNARKAWEYEGMPLLAENQNGIRYEHPLSKLVRESERAAQLASKDLPKPKRRPGPSPLAVVQPGIEEAPSVKRRRLKAV